jgi:murein DD-endopeptidase MepM/ murein hydrolase activator NlpD
LLLAGTGLRPAPFAGELLAPKRPEQADATAGGALNKAQKIVPPDSVPADYFLFPIKPGKANFLAGSMGEIRPNHFHGGLDIKTDGRIDLPVYASADGIYIAHETVSFRLWQCAVYHSS